MRSTILFVIVLAMFSGCASVECDIAIERSAVLLVDEAPSPAEGATHEPRFVVSVSYEEVFPDDVLRMTHITGGVFVRGRSRSISLPRITLPLGEQGVLPITVVAEHDVGELTLVETFSREFNAKFVVGRIQRAAQLLRAKVESYDPAAQEGSITLEFAVQDEGRLTFYVPESSLRFRLKEPVALKPRPDLLSVPLFPDPPPQDSAGLMVNDVRAYFENLPVGYNVARIEDDLGLPKPRETEAPAYGCPGWKFLYFTDGIVVYFVAEGEEGDSEACVYVGEWAVSTEREHWDTIRRLQEIGRAR